MLEEYKEELEKRELAQGTINGYIRAVEDLLEFADGEVVTKELLIDYKKELLKKYKPSTANNKIVIINNYLDFKEKDIAIKSEKIQRNTTLDNVLTETDFNRLIRNAENKNKPRTKIIMLTLYYTGIRVSEMDFLTVEALKKGYLDINNKGKHRRVPIAKALEKELKKYVKEEGIKEGVIIRNNRGEPLGRTQIFKDLKWIAGQARVKKDKVYPHSFRHLFAKQWLKHNNNNVLALADLLGHESLETTRIYTTLTTDEQRDTISF